MEEERARERERDGGGDGDRRTDGEGLDEGRLEGACIEYSFVPPQSTLKHLAQYLR